MLQKVLSREACAACRFCCAFRRKSLWEVPEFPVEFVEKYPVGISGEKIQYLIQEKNGSPYAITDLRENYHTEDPEEEAPCPFLDSEKGCTLPEEDKSFDCKIWPLRYMRREDGTEAICLTPTCPEINQLPLAEMKKLVQDGLGRIIMDYAKEHPHMMKDYQENFPVLMEMKGEEEKDEKKDEKTES